MERICVDMHDDLDGRRSAVRGLGEVGLGDGDERVGASQGWRESRRDGAVGVGVAGALRRFRGNVSRFRSNLPAVGGSVDVRGDRGDLVADLVGLGGLKRARAGSVGR